MRYSTRGVPSDEVAVRGTLATGHALTIEGCANATPQLSSKWAGAAKTRQCNVELTSRPDD